MYYRARRIPKLGINLGQQMKKKFLWRAIKAGQASSIYQKLSQEIKELKETEMVSYADNILKISVSSGLRRQEINLRKEKIILELNKAGMETKEIKIIM